MGRINYDYKEIACRYNTAGATDTYRFIREKYGVHNPYDVIKRMKKSGSYSYDRDSDQFVGVPDDNTENVFMNLKELCGQKTTEKTKTQESAVTMEVLVKQLLEDRLLQLSNYVQMNQSSRTVLIDRTTMVEDGYQVIIH